MEDWLRLYKPLFPENFRWNVVSEDPLIIKFYNILSSQEIQEIEQIASGIPFEPSTMIINSETIVHPRRTSETCILTNNGQKPLDNDKEYEPVIENLLRRICILSRNSHRHIEAIHLTKYEPGQKFEEHMDTFEDNTSTQRIGTFMIWMNDMNNDNEGETEFTRLGINCYPDKGCALFWWNITDDDEAFVDYRLMHKGHPPIYSTKKILNIWIRDKEFD